MQQTEWAWCGETNDLHVCSVLHMPAVKHPAQGCNFGAMWCCCCCVGVAAPKRRRVDDSAEIQEVPKWLEIKPTDDEKTKQKKRKLAKAYKSKARFARLDLQQKQKADAWKAFMSGGKGKKKVRVGK